MICSTCGHENSDRAKFCENCASPLAAPAYEQRKTVTVLFCDVTGSTALGESTDPEALRAVLARYFERMKAIVARHDGEVEKFIGDAVMAVFGVPQVHEDDALRACSAALEMRAALPELGVQARIGLNTGEVVTGTEERLATGDAVNVAARLEQAAAPGEILLGAETLRHVGEAVQAERVEPLELKGKSEPVAAYRLLSVSGRATRRHESRFVGRKRELELFREAWELALSERRSRLITLVGDAGVGKSRLVAEFLAAIDVRVVEGRCLSYGEGITYWPAVEVLKQLDSLPSDPAAAHALRSLLGEDEDGTSPEEIAWAFRKLLEEQAPLAVVFEDIHWAEETFLELVEHVALLSTGAPILLLCLARPELIERRPQWPAPLRLDPLPEAEVEDLLPDGLAADLRAKIATAAGGNPLFVTEMVAMTREAEGEVVVPPTLKALLAARLDQLEHSERQVLERGAVEGELFHRGAVQELSPDGQVTPRLAALVRKELIRPDTPQLPAEDAFRFRHLLIRDAAYDALPKAVRAELHERFAGWLEERGRGLVELDEILGYHLEQAARYKSELGQADPELAVRAGTRLAAAGRRAMWRGDNRAAAPLLRRALELTRPIRLDVDLEVDLSWSRGWSGSHVEGAEIAEAAAERAHAAGDQRGEAVARLVASHHRALTGGSIDQLEQLARAALPMLEERSDHAGLAEVWFALGNSVANFHGRFEDWTRAAEHSNSLGHVAPGRVEGNLAHALVLGPRPADAALQALDAAVGPNPHPGQTLLRAILLAMLGREDAWSVGHEAHLRWRELRRDHGGEHLLADVASLRGDEETAVRLLRTWCEYLERHELTSALSTYSPRLGRSLCVLGRYEEAEPLARLGRELGDEQDAVTQFLWRQVQALVCSARDEHAEAERLAREAIEIAERTDALNYQADARCDLAEVLVAAERIDEASEELERALHRYERKKNVAMVARVRPKVAQ